MTPDASHLLDQVSYTSGEQVFVGNGKGLQIHHVGTFVFKPFSSYSFKLKNLLHVPHIKKNLLSVSQFARDNNIYFEFYPNSCYVKSQNSKETLLQGTLKSGLCSFSPVQPVIFAPTSFLASTKGDATFKIWHLRLGHPSTDVVSRVSVF